jgi:CRP/FNR family transcriptional regulator, cyclic AMP receptor protein
MPPQWALKAVPKMLDGDDLAGVSVLNRLNAAERVTVASTARDLEIAEGTRLFEEGQEAVGCWLIRSGQVALQTSVPGRGQVVVQTLGPGDVLGWSWLVPPYQWHFTATAQGPVTAVWLDTARLHALADLDPALGHHLALGLLEVLLARLQSTRSRLLDLYKASHGPT